MIVTILQGRRNNKKIQLNCESRHQSLLDTLEMHLVPVEFQCRSGYCGTCRLRLIDGKVKYNLEPLAFVHHGEILPCCCLPVENIKLAL
ncbi:class I ribonucleotide reductase maintenance protein YfaE [Candidatus Palibaumannia cicadellinicola]|uniref:Iron-sulfur cluster binding protein n=1 Tax=Baumannia cicadellinicola subsp. Homalodisca coagulata TaxID=374463 RepID=Q1LT86_BAUCH|nr:class I ribonucleotide reductase maintenance protein YfaE [Candidatus Baumannia cicadellinicola]ABF14342.1 iron-sulfur cluster binding protein [Baumannia cicadellinicola str. Hc (Homalodisca coagulata)]MCJ7462476.1 class I ribonucleotide reductase maintenance protein YfaE [Candidatus Baumannia cicadellinicola]MCJ7462709.1 class I ribonucleotide reductase maintenance protein YfaE [Candidatus Baumannia cicadellinicola]